MKPPFFFALILTFALSACSDRSALDKRAQEDAAAKARAAAHQKEMEALPQAFQTPDYLKKNAPTPTPHR